MTDRKQYTMQKAVPPEIVLEIQNRAALGWSYRQIKDWLAKEKNITYSHVSIGRIVKKHLSERRQYSEEILKPYLQKTLTSDLDLLDAIIQDAKRVLNEAQKSKEPRLVLAAIDRLDKLLNTRRKFTGISDKDDDLESESIEINYQEQIDRLAALRKKDDE